LAYEAWLVRSVDRLGISALSGNDMLRSPIVKAEQGLLAGTNGLLADIREDLLQRRFSGVEP
jgi:hypothetical protein